MSPGTKFRQALAAERPLQVVGTIVAYHALLAKRTGYRAIYLSGGGVAAGSLGMPDLGINTLDAGIPPRNDTPTNMGNRSTTTGVLFTKALSAAALARVSSSEKEGATAHSRASTAATGRSAPVVSRPWPIIISAQTATNAS